MLVENLLLTAQFILSVVFSFLRQAIKMGRFLHNYQFFLTLVEQISRIGNTVQPTLPCWVVPTAGSLSIMACSLVFLLSFCCRLIKCWKSIHFVVLSVSTKLSEFKKVRQPRRIVDIFSISLFPAAKTILLNYQFRFLTLFTIASNVDEINSLTNGRQIDWKICYKSYFHFKYNLPCRIGNI